MAYGRLQNKYRHLEAVRYEADRYLQDLKRNRQLLELNQRMYYDQLYSQNYGRERYYSHYDEILPYRYRETERREDRQMKRNLENVADMIPKRSTLQSGLPDKLENIADCP